MVELFRQWHNCELANHDNVQICAFFHGFIVNRNKKVKIRFTNSHILTILSTVSFIQNL